MGDADRIDANRILGNVGEVIHVMGNLYLTKRSSRDDFTHALQRVRGGLDALEIPVVDRRELDAEFEEALTAAGSRSLDDARLEMEANYFGPLAMSRSFSPVLARNGGGALVNVLSVLSFVTFPAVATYAASKAAAWSLTNSLRQELGEQGTQVVGVHVGYIDTDMAAHITSDKVKPEDVAAAILDGLAAGLSEVLVDDLSRGAKAALSNPL